MLFLGRALQGSRTKVPFRRCLTIEQVSTSKLHPTYKAGVPRIFPVNPKTNAKDGVVAISLPKAAWFTTVSMGAVLGILATFDPALILQDFAFFFGTTGTTILLGHSLGMHRKFIHNSFDCPKWFEYFLVHLGTLVGIAGPLEMMKAHDFRDWAQRQPPGECHDYYGQQGSFLRDSHWQMCCALDLAHPPTFYAKQSEDVVYQWMQRTWQLQQIPYAILFYYLGGLHFVVWGGFARIVAGMYGHFMVGYFAHNEGAWAQMNLRVKGVAIQGMNVGVNNKILAVLSAGEAYHNNHHAYPGSANLAIKPGEWDLGYQTLKLFEKIGLVWNIKEIKDLPERKELEPVE